MFPLLGRLCALPENIRLGLEGAGDKHSSLFGPFVIYEEKEKCYEYGPRSLTPSEERFRVFTGWAPTRKH
jgi:hypothetical protein